MGGIGGAPTGAQQQEQRQPPESSNGQQFTTAGTVWQPQPTPLQPPVRRGRTLKTLMQDSYPYEDSSPFSPSSFESTFPPDADNNKNNGNFSRENGLASTSTSANNFPSTPKGLSSTNNFPSAADTFNFSSADKHYSHYSPLQQNFDRAVRPSSPKRPGAFTQWLSEVEREDDSEFLSRPRTMPMPTYYPPTPDAQGHVQAQNQALAKRAEANSQRGVEEHAMGDGTFSVTPEQFMKLNNMSTQTLNNLASYTNPHQKAAQQILSRARQAPSTPSAQRQVSGGSTRTDENIMPNQPFGPGSAHSAHLTPTTRDPYLSRGPGAPQPLAAGPPGQRHFRPSALEQPAFNPQNVWQKSSEKLSHGLGQLAISQHGPGQPTSSQNSPGQSAIPQQNPNTWQQGATSQYGTGQPAVSQYGPGQNGPGQHGLGQPATSQQTPWQQGPTSQYGTAQPATSQYGTGQPTVSQHGPGQPATSQHGPGQQGVTSQQNPNPWQQGAASQYGTGQPATSQQSPWQQGPDKPREVNSFNDGTRYQQYPFTSSTQLQRATGPTQQFPVQYNPPHMRLGASSARPIGVNTESEPKKISDTLSAEEAHKFYPNGLPADFNHDTDPIADDWQARRLREVEEEEKRSFLKQNTPEAQASRKAEIDRRFYAGQNMFNKDIHEAIHENQRRKIARVIGSEYEEPKKYEGKVENRKLTIAEADAIPTHEHMNPLLSMAFQKFAEYERTQQAKAEQAKKEEQAKKLDKGKGKADHPI